MDIEGTIQYIINQQAEFVANMHSLEQAQRVQGERIDKLYEIVMHHEDAHVVTYGMIDKLAARLGDVVERQGWLFEGHRLLTESQQRLTESQQRLTEAQTRTDAKVDKLADKIDRFIDEVRKNATGRNGGAEN